MLNKPLPIAWKKKALFIFFEAPQWNESKATLLFRVIYIYMHRYIYIYMYIYIYIYTYIHIIYTVKRGNFRILDNFGFFNAFSLLTLLCVCGACHSFLLYDLRKRLGPRFSSWFFWTLALPSRSWLSACFKELLVPTRIVLLNHIVHLNTVNCIVRNWTNVL